MKVLMISTDRLIFVPDSAVSRRLIKLAEKYERLVVIVFAKKSLGLREFDLASNIKVIPTNSFSRLNYIWDAINLGKSLGSIDFITAQDPFEVGLVGRSLALFHKAKLELQIHTDFLSPYFKELSILNRLRIMVAGWILPQADQVRVVSERIKKSLEAKNWNLKADIEVRPVEIDLEKLKQTPITIDLHQKYPQFKKIILMASRLEPEKQINLAIKSLIKLLIAEDIGLVIVGTGSEEGKLRILVDQLGIAGHVKFEGWQSDLSTYYKTADLFLVASAYEGYGMTMVEAKACGLPIVSTDVGIAQEIGAIITTINSLDPVVRKILVN